MRTRLARLLLICALLMSTAGVTVYLLSAPTDAAQPTPLPHLAWHHDSPIGSDTVEAMSGRERPAQRPVRSDYDDPDRRLRSSSIEALLHRSDAHVQD